MRKMRQAGLSRAYCKMLNQACKPDLKMLWGKEPAAESGTAAWKGARPERDAADAGSGRG